VMAVHCAASNVAWVTHEAYEVCVVSGLAQRRCSVAGR